MAALIVTATALAGFVLVLGLYLKICGAIRREDRVRGSLRFDPVNRSAQAARLISGVTSSRWG